MAGRKPGGMNIPRTRLVHLARRLHKRTPWWVCVISHEMARCEVAGPVLLVVLVLGCGGPADRSQIDRYHMGMVGGDRTQVAWCLHRVVHGATKGAWSVHCAAVVEGPARIRIGTDGFELTRPGGREIARDCAGGEQFWVGRDNSITAIRDKLPAEAFLRLGTLQGTRREELVDQVTSLEELAALVRDLPAPAE